MKGGAHVQARDGEDGTRGRGDVVANLHRIDLVTPKGHGNVLLSSTSAARTACYGRVPATAVSDGIRVPRRGKGFAVLAGFLGLVLVIRDVRGVAMRCYHGVSYSRVATEPVNPKVLIPKPGVPVKDVYSEDDVYSPSVPAVTCNDTETIVYTGCYAACQTVSLQNMTAGQFGLDFFEVHLCKYGCASEVQINSMRRFKQGALQFDFMCDCQWDRTGTFWTDYNLDHKGPVWCCPSCHWNLPSSPARCVDEFSLKLAPCVSTELCNLSPASRILVQRALTAGLGLATASLALLLS
jgi:hypothetical protein